MFKMNFIEELYCAMVEVDACARWSKLPEPLAPRLATRFTSMVLAGPTNLRAAIGIHPDGVLETDLAAQIHNFFG